MTISGTAFAGHQDFILKNQTGRDIVDIYIAPSQSTSWGEDILGVEFLHNGDETQIIFDRNETNRYWAMMATFSDGSNYIWEDIDLFSVSEITLRFDGMAIEK